MAEGALVGLQRALVVALQSLQGLPVSAGELGQVDKLQDKKLCVAVEHSTGSRQDSFRRHMNPYRCTHNPEADKQKLKLVAADKA